MRYTKTGEGEVHSTSLARQRLPLTQPNKQAGATTMAKTAATNLPTLPTSVKVRLSRKTKKLELVFLAPVKEEEVKPVEPAVFTPAYTQAALELDAAVFELEKVFAKKPVQPSTPPVVSTPVCKTTVYAKISPSVVQATGTATSTVKPFLEPVQARKIDYATKGNLNGNRGFQFLR